MAEKRAFRDQANPTPAEVALRTHLDHAGIKYTFQPIVEGYIPDFRIKRTKLLIELDGSVHDSPERQAADAAKDQNLAAKGWVVLRFQNAMVFERPLTIIGLIVSRSQKGRHIGR